MKIISCILSLILCKLKIPFHELAGISGIQPARVTIKDRLLMTAGKWRINNEIQEFSHNIACCNGMRFSDYAVLAGYDPL
ncbi:hypothetical protein D3C80_1884030 [compost metagenome]